MSEGERARAHQAIRSRALDRFRFAVERPVAVLVIFAALVVFGGFALLRLPLELMPDIAYPKLTVRAEFPGAAPSEVEDDVARPLEEVLGVVSGVTRIESISRAGSVDVVLEFAWGTELDEANQDVLEKIDLVRPTLPDEVEAPLILRYDPSLDPVMVLRLGPKQVDDLEDDPHADLRRLRRLAEREVERLLEPIPGVAAVKVEGGLEEEIHVDLEEEALRRTSTGIGDVIRRIESENVNVAGGTMHDGRMRHLVRTVNEFGDLEQIRRMVVARRSDRDLRLSELGRVRRAHADPTVITRVDAKPAIRLEVYKEADANIVRMARRVESALNQRIRPRMDEQYDLDIDIVTDRSTFIESTIAELRDTALMGGALAIAILFLFLRSVRTTVIIAVAIPVSVVMTFAPLNSSGVSLNVMSLGGLALGIGMLVDNAIVVLESIHRCREEGDSLRAATLRGTSEVGLAVVAATLTSVAVFLPMVFVEGVAGQMFGDLGLAVVFSLLASLAVALSLIPMLSSREAAGAGAGEERSIGLLARLQQSWTTFASVADLVRAFTSRPSWLGWIVGVPYAIVRFSLHFPLELTGKFVATVSSLFGELIVLVGLGAGGWLLMVTTRPFTWVFEKIMAAFQAVYQRSLGFCLANAWLVYVALAGFSFLVVQQAKTLDSELIPEVHQGEFSIQMRAPVGTALAETDRQVQPIEAALLEQVPHLRTMTTMVGSERDSNDAQERGEHTAKMTIALAAGGGQGSLLQPKDDGKSLFAPPEETGEAEPEDPDRIAEREAAKNRARAAAALDTRTAEREALAVVRRLVAERPGIEVDISKPVLFSFKRPVELEIRGHDLVELGRIAEQVARRLQAIDGVDDVQVSMRRGQPELQIVYDRDALARYELQIREVAELVRDKVQGREASKFNLGDRKVPIRVRLAAEDRVGIEELRRMVVNPGGERPITLGAVAKVDYGQSPSEIRRVGQRRVALVTANLDGVGLAVARSRIEATLTEMVLPPRTEIVFAGQAEEWERSSLSLYLAMALSVFLVYVIMAAQFEHLGHPLIILVAIPLALGGVVLALAALDLAVSVVVGLGVIMLCGIVVNNAIVLVDYVNQLRHRGLELREALQQAGAARLRPILMTTSTTVLGLLPMAVGLGDGAEIRQPMAITVIAGLAVSTVLTLIVVPVLYAGLDRLFGRNVPGAAAFALEAALSEMEANEGG